MKKTFFLALISGALVTVGAEAPKESVREQELAVALVPKVQTPSADSDVTLARFSLVCGRHRNVYGFDLGVLGNLTQEGMMGFAVSGLFNHAGSSSGALQVAGIFNYVKGDFAGLQIATANYAMGECIGLQVGAVNIAGTLYGMQVGAFNKTHDGEAFQLGVINVADQLTGAQLGLININHNSSVRMAPIFNCNF